MTVTATSLPMINDSPAGRYTVDQLANKVGMSPRNIRAYQSRKLLPPPARSGRQVYYDDRHLRRLEAVRSLQRQGFNLVSIEAILGVHAAEPRSDTLARVLHQLQAEHPPLVCALTRHGVVSRDGDDTVHATRPRTVRAALALQQAGVPALESLQLLSEVLDRIQPLAHGLIREAGARVLALSPDCDATSELPCDTGSGNLTQALVALLAESFRTAAENCGESTVGELVADRAATPAHRSAG